MVNLRCLIDFEGIKCQIERKQIMKLYIKTLQNGTQCSTKLRVNGVF